MDGWTPSVGRTARRRLGSGREGGECACEEGGREGDWEKKGASEADLVLDRHTLSQGGRGGGVGE